MHKSISDMVIDCLQNSVEANSTNIILDFEETDKTLFVKITDNGKGMDSIQLEKAKDPFWTDGIKHKKRKVGLGIPFLIQTVEATNGSYGLSSTPNVGTELFFKLDLKNIDLPPIGKCVDTFFSALIFDGNYELTINRSYFDHKYVISRCELIEVLGDFNSVNSLNLLKTFLESQEAEIEEIKNG